MVVVRASMRREMRLELDMSVVFLDWIRGRNRWMDGWIR